MKTNYERIIEKLDEIGAVCVRRGTIEDANFENELDVEHYDVNGKGLLVLSDGEGEVGLYRFVGTDGDEVEKDLTFINELAA